MQMQQLTVLHLGLVTALVQLKNGDPVVFVT